MGGSGFIGVRVEVIGLRIITRDGVIGKNRQIGGCRSSLTSLRLLYIKAKVHNTEKFATSLACKGPDAALVIPHGTRARTARQG